MHIAHAHAVTFRNRGVLTVVYKRNNWISWERFRRHCGCICNIPYVIQWFVAYFVRRNTLLRWRFKSSWIILFHPIAENQDYTNLNCIKNYAPASPWQQSSRIILSYEFTCLSVHIFHPQPWLQVAKSSTQYLTDSILNRLLCFQSGGVFEYHWLWCHKSVYDVKKDNKACSTSLWR